MRFPTFIRPKTEKEQTHDLAEPTPTPSLYVENGTSGLNILSGFVRQAYSTELYWPQCSPLYDRIWRSDPECTVARTVMETLSSEIQIGVEIPVSKYERVKPTDDDKKARDFLYQALDDIADGGIQAWITSCMTRVPFYGWGAWETLWGVRQEGWRAPGGDIWESEYNDGMIGIRRLAFRYYSSFFSWENDDKGRVTGMVQLDPQGRQVTIPETKLLHVRFGDRDNPEGLATLEALWRLERLKYGLEIVQGIGFEHSAGYLNVQAKSTLSPEDKNQVRLTARAVMTAQEGNFALWPSSLEGDLKDVPFSAGAAILDAVRYYGILKLALFGMQWAALGTLSPYGSFSSMSDASSLFMKTFNAMAEGFIQQLDDQVGRRLFKLPQNRAKFPNLTARPRIVLSKRVEKNVPLTELAQFLQAMSSILPMDDEDILAIRRASEILPERLPSTNKVLAPQPTPGVGTQHTVAKPKEKTEETEEEEPEEKPKEEGNLAARKFIVSEDELPTDVIDDAIISADEADKAISRFIGWANKNDPEIAGILKARENDNGSSGQ